MIKKKPRKYVIEKWRIEDYERKLIEFEKKLKYLSETSCVPKIKIYSAGTDVCIGMNHKLWHRIVCNYNGNTCLGSPRPHWTSSWTIDELGFHLESMLDESWKGWHGQYNPKNELKYHELPREILMQHHNHLVLHIKNLSIYYPCAIYNDFTGELSSP